MSTRNEELESKIIEVIRSSPEGTFEGGSHRLALTLGRQQKRVSQALNEMIRTGRVSRQHILGDPFLVLSRPLEQQLPTMLLGPGYYPWCLQ